MTYVLLGLKLVYMFKFFKINLRNKEKSAGLLNITVFLLLILLVSSFVFTNIATAQNTGVIVYPSIIELDFAKNPRKFVSKVINVLNTSNKTARVRAYIQGWDMDKYGGLIFLDTPDNFSLDNYVKFNPIEFELAPNQKQLVRLTAKLPEGIDGEFRSIIFFETVTPREEILQPDKSKISLMVTFKTRYGVAVYAYKGSTSRNALLENFSLQKIDDNQYLVATLKNEGNIHTNVEGELTLIPNKDSQSTSLKAYRYTILPGRTQDYKIQLPEKQMSSNNYTAKLRLTYKDIQEKEQVLMAETTFNYEPSKVTDKKDLEKPVSDEEIKMTPDNIAQPIPVDVQSEIKLK